MKKKKDIMWYDKSYYQPFDFVQHRSVFKQGYFLRSFVTILVD